MCNNKATPIWCRDALLIPLLSYHHKRLLSKMEAQVYRKLCEILKSELLRLGFTRESLSSLLASSDEEEDAIHSKLSSRLKDSENITIVSKNSVPLCCKEANAKY